MKLLTHLRTLALLFLATFMIFSCKPDQNLNKLKQKPNQSNTAVIKTDTGIVSVTDLKFLGRYAYYDSLQVDTIMIGGKEIGSTGIISSPNASLRVTGKFRGYVNVYEARLPVIGSAHGLEITFATVFDLSKDEGTGIIEVTPAGPYKATLLTTNEFLVGTEEVGKLPDSIYVFRPETLRNPPESALKPPVEEEKVYTPIFDTGKM